MGPAEPLFTPRACSACTKRVSRPVQATDTYKSNIFLALWKMSHVEILWFKMSPRTCVLCQKTWLRPSTAPSNVLNVMSKTGLQDGGTEILLLRMAFTLKKLTWHHSPFNVRIYENASPLLNLRQGWFSHFENHVRLSIYLTGRVFVKSKKKMYRVQIPRQETFGKCKFKDMERTLAKPGARRRFRVPGTAQETPIRCRSTNTLHLSVPRISSKSKGRGWGGERTTQIQQSLEKKILPRDQLPAPTRVPPRSAKLWEGLQHQGTGHRPNAGPGECARGRDRGDSAVAAGLMLEPQPPEGGLDPNGQLPPWTKYQCHPYDRNTAPSLLI